MNVEDELLHYIKESGVLKSNTENEISLKSRNIDLVACFYGFRESKWPTLEDVAEIYNIGSRERVRQIINKAFRDHAKSERLPAIKRCAAILEERSYWKAETYLNELFENGIEVRGNNVRGLLNLMRDLDLAPTYAAYTTDFREMRRGLLNQGLEIVLTTQHRCEELRCALKLVSDRPGRVGIANLNLLAEEQLWSEELHEIISHTITLHPRAWCWREGGNFWYTFEQRQTTLRTYIEKVFSVITSTSVQHLSLVYENALRARTVEIPFPPAYVIETYLRESLLFQHNGEFIQFTGEIGELTDIEREMVEFLKNRQNSGYVELRDHLLEKKLSLPLINKNTANSCLVYVDRSLGRKKHIYSLVNQVGNKFPSTLNFDEYSFYLERLRMLYEDETDGVGESTWRKEQGILQEWLFKGKTTEQCALCGEEFHVDALVTAHKKKRALCTSVERLDPYIVMPICVFGCDFLYERGYLSVVKGRIELNTSKTTHTSEYRRAFELKGKPINEKWLRGKPDYFNNYH